MQRAQINLAQRDRTHWSRWLARTNGKHKSPYGCLTITRWISNLKPECVEVNQLEYFVQKAQGFILPLIMFMLSAKQ